MLLSLSHSFLFVHVTKTAGVAITEALAPFSLLKERNLFRRVSSHFPIQEAKEQLYLRTHDTAAHAKRKLGPEVFDDLHSFGVVRNPYARAVSYYEYYRQNTNHPRHGRVAAMSFDEYLNELQTSRDTANVTQSDFLCDQSGQILVRNVLRFERLQSDFQILCLHLGLRIELKTANTSRQRPINDYYTPRTMKLVEDLYATDFQAFGYAIGHLPNGVTRRHREQRMAVGGLRQVV